MAGRNPEPWFWQARGAWYVTIRGKRHRLATAAEGRERAKAEFHRLMAAEGMAPTESTRRGLKVRDVFNLFLAETDRLVAGGERSRHTLDGYLRFLKSAAKDFGQLDVADLKPFHVARWADGKARWGPTTRFNAVTAVKAATSWSREVGRIEVDPLAKLKRPKPRRREAIPTDDQVEAMLGAIRDRAFRDLVELMHDTGARPGEMIRAEAADVVVEGGAPVAIRLRRHKTAEKTGRDRVIYLTDRAAAIVARLARERPSGPLLLNRGGRPWTRNAMACRFKRLRERLGGGPEFTAYALRHKWVTDHLSNGTPIATVSELAGHADTTMVSRVYSKLSERSTHLREAARGLRRDSHG